MALATYWFHFTKQKPSSAYSVECLGVGGAEGGPPAVREHRDQDYVSVCLGDLLLLGKFVNE